MESVSRGKLLRTLNCIPSHFCLSERNENDLPVLIDLLDLKISAGGKGILHWVLLML